MHLLLTKGGESPPFTFLMPSRHLKLFRIECPRANHPPLEMSDFPMANASQCPFSSGARANTLAGASSNATWWPNQLNLGILHQHSSLSSPMDGSFNYAKEFASLDLQDRKSVV